MLMKNRMGHRVPQVCDQSSTPIGVHAAQLALSNENCFSRSTLRYTGQKEREITRLITEDEDLNGFSICPDLQRLIQFAGKILNLLPDELSVCGKLTEQVNILSLLLNDPFSALCGADGIHCKRSGEQQQKRPTHGGISTGRLERRKTKN